MALDPGEIDLLRTAMQEAVESAQEKLALMVARQFVEIRTEIQNVQDAVRKVSTRQVQVEADLAEVGRNSELIKRRLSDLHDDLGAGADRVLQDRELSLRIDCLEREVADLRNRVSPV